MAHFRYLLAIGALCLASANSRPTDYAPVQQVDSALSGWPVGNFALVDQLGRTFTGDRLQDRWTFLLLGDSGCGEACAAALFALNGMCRRIARTEVVKMTQVLFVSLDAERDAPETLHNHLASFDGQFIGLSGSRENLARLVEDLTPPGAQTQASSLWLIGPDGIVRGEFLPPYDIPQLTARFLKMRIGR